ncbi:MAG: sulfatase-like hydrolase/transferase [Acidimicrobiales bacterium]
MTADVATDRRALPSGWPFVVLGLTGFAITQPLLSLAGSNPTLFVFARTGRLEIVLLAVGIAFVPPLSISALVAVAHRIHATLGQWIYRGVAAALAFVAGVWIGRDIGGDLVALAGGVLAVALVVAAVLRAGVVAEWLRYTAILPFLALGLFLFASESSDLLRPLDDAERAEFVGDTPSLVVLVLDELPTRSLLDADGNIDAARFPNFAALAADSTWYRNYAAQSGTTRTAFPTMLTGREPRLRSPVWTNYPDNLFSLLAPTHHLTVHEAFTRMCGVSTCSEEGPSGEEVEPPAPDHALSQLIDLWTERLRGPRTVGQEALDDFREQVDAEPPEAIPFKELGIFEPGYLEQWPTRFSRFLDVLEPSPNPTLWFLHLLLPHVPWEFYADGTLYATVPRGSELGELNTVEWLSAVNEARHLLQVQYTDALLGELIARLEANGLYDDTALVVVADHGVSFEIGTENRDISGPGRPGTAFAPLFVKPPGPGEAIVSDENLMAIDLLPLIADLTGTTIDWDIDGSAPGSAAIERRGTDKYTFAIEGPDDNRRLSEALHYDGEADFPTAADRWIRPWQEGDGELDALLELLDNDDLIGVPLDELSTEAAGRVQVWSLNALTTAPTDPPPALVQGRVEATLDAAEVLVAVDGTIVTGSKVYPTENGPGFLAMLPSALVGEAMRLDFVVVTNDGRLITPALTSL